MPLYNVKYFDDGKFEKVSLTVQLAGVESSHNLHVTASARHVTVHVPGRYRLVRGCAEMTREKAEGIVMTRRRSSVEGRGYCHDEEEVKCGVGTHQLSFHIPEIHSHSLCHWRFLWKRNPSF